MWKVFNHRIRSSLTLNVYSNPCTVWLTAWAALYESLTALPYAGIYVIKSHHKRGWTCHFKARANSFYMFIDNLINSVSADWISIIFIAALDIRNKKGTTGGVGAKSRGHGSFTIVLSLKKDHVFRWWETKKARWMNFENVARFIGINFDDNTFNLTVYHGRFRLF